MSDPTAAAGAALGSHVYHADVPGRPRRALLLLHGTGGDERALLPLARMLDPDAAILSPRGNVLEQGAPRFFRRIAEGVFDLPDLHARTAALARWLAAARAHHGLDGVPLIAVGYSNGANIAASLLLSEPRALDGAILLRAMTPFEPEVHAVPRLPGTPVLIATGRLDPIAPPDNAGHLAALLRDAGAEVTQVFADGGHPLTPGDVDAARHWLQSLDATPPA